MDHYPRFPPSVPLSELGALSDTLVVDTAGIRHWL